MDILHFAKSELSKTDKEYKRNTRFIQRLVDRNIQAQKQKAAYFKRTLSVSPHRPSRRDCKSGGVIGSQRSIERSPDHSVLASTS